MFMQDVLFNILGIHKISDKNTTSFVFLFSFNAKNKLSDQCITFIGIKIECVCKLICPLIQKLACKYMIEHL